MMATARVLFIISGVFWLIIGALSGILVDRNVGSQMVLLSPSTDAQLFGAPAQQVLADSSGVFLARYALIRWVAGFLVGSGVLVIGLAWFGLRGDEIWALAVLTVAGLAVIPYWWISLGQYRAAGIRVGLGDIPPFMWVPAILMTVGALLGWIASITQTGP